MKLVDGKVRYIPVDAYKLYHDIRASHHNAQCFAYYLEFLTFNIPNSKLIPALEMLRKQKIVGERFITFIENDCQSSPLEFIRQVTMRLEKEKKPRKLYAVDLTR